MLAQVENIPSPQEVSSHPFPISPPLLCSLLLRTCPRGGKVARDRVTGNRLNSHGSPGVPIPMSEPTCGLPDAISICIEALLVSLAHSLVVFLESCISQRLDYEKQR